MLVQVKPAERSSSSVPEPAALAYGLWHIVSTWTTLQASNACITRGSAAISHMQTLHNVKLQGFTCLQLRGSVQATSSAKAGVLLVHCCAPECSTLARPHILKVENSKMNT